MNPFTSLAQSPRDRMQCQVIQHQDTLREQFERKNYDFMILLLLGGVGTVCCPGGDPLAKLANPLSVGRERGFGAKLLLPLS